MPNAKNPELSFPDLVALMDKALETERGVSIDMAEVYPNDDPETDYKEQGRTTARRKAIAAKWNFYSIRKRDRERTRKVYETDSPNYDTSPYDSLSCVVDDTVVTIKRMEGWLDQITIRDPLTGETI